MEISITKITESSAQFRITCSDTPPSNVKGFAINLIPLDNSKSYSKNISLSCPKMINFTELTPNTTFKVAVVWYLEIALPSECILEEFTTLSG